MTYVYNWGSMPDELAIKCPACKGLAEFKFATVVKIKLKKDVEFFKESDAFEYSFEQDSSGRSWHLATFYSWLHGGIESITSLPEGYAPENWSHVSRYMKKGVCRCSQCGTKKHELDWPLDAYFSIEYKGEHLWAYSRDYAVALRDFIESDERVTRSKYMSFLLKIPTVFKKSNARDTVVKKLNKLLS